MKSSLCAVPHSKVFVIGNGRFRNCCAADPQLVSKDADLDAWWQGSDMRSFRESLQSDQLPHACRACEIQEKIQNHSFRLAVNHQINRAGVDTDLGPCSWHIVFGNTCNLGCWTCNENYSSVIANDKNKLGILPASFLDPKTEFEKSWPDLRSRIIKSYDAFDSITITLLGGEPMYSPLVLKFLGDLISSKLSSRTRLEITTNGTGSRDQILKLLDPGLWQYISVFVSVDAVDHKASWLRYGTNWENVRDNIDRFYRSCFNYFEIHTTLSILNIRDLPQISDFVESLSAPWMRFVLNQPWFMDIRKWDGDLRHFQYKTSAPHLQEYLDMIGKTPQEGAKEKLRSYITEMSKVRKKLREFDPELSLALDL